MAVTPRTIGWLFVGAQIVLLLVLVSLPARDDWPTPSGVVALSAVCTIGGMIVIAVSIFQLGRSITASPVPAERAELVTTGLYRIVRHPIYSGLLVVVIGVVLRSGSSITAGAGAVTIAFFVAKARWEERRLAERYTDYEAYAAVTPRFVPRRHPHASRGRR